MCRSLLFPVAATLLLVAASERARGDGGQIRLVERHGDSQVTVFTAPTPMCAGWADISVAVQNASTRERISNARIAIELRHRDPQVPVIRATATNEAATNKLLQAVLVELPVQGTWDVTVRVSKDGQSQPFESHFAMTVAPPWPSWISEWPWFCWPVIPILLFIMHRVLVSARASVSAGS
jgi:hypothetical protein